MTSEPHFSVGRFRHPSELTSAASYDTALCRAPLALRVLNVLADAAATTGHCYRSIKRLAEKLGSDRRAVRRALALLVRLGYVQQRMRPNRKVYDFDLPIGPDSQTGPAAMQTAPPPPSGGSSQPPVISGGASHPAASGGASRPSLRGAPHTPEPLEPGLEPGSKDLDHLDPGPRSARRSRKRAPEPPPGASLEELVRHAATHGKAAGQVVIRRMAERLEIDPVSAGGLIGKYLWPVARGEDAPDRLCKAARWAEKALDRRNEAKHRPIDGFLLIASGQDDVPWPVAAGSQAAAVACGAATATPRRSACAAGGVAVPAFTPRAPAAFAAPTPAPAAGRRRVSAYDFPGPHLRAFEFIEECGLPSVTLEEARPPAPATAAIAPAGPESAGEGEPAGASAAHAAGPSIVSKPPTSAAELDPPPVPSPPKSYQEQRAELDRDPERRRALWREKFGLEAPPQGRPRSGPDPGPRGPTHGRDRST